MSCVAQLDRNSYYQAGACAGQKTGGLFPVGSDQLTGHNV